GDGSSGAESPHLGGSRRALRAAHLLTRCGDHLTICEGSFGGLGLASMRDLVRRLVLCQNRVPLLQTGPPSTVTKDNEFVTSRSRNGLVSVTFDPATPRHSATRKTCEASSIGSSSAPSTPSIC